MSVQTLSQQEELALGCSRPERRAFERSAADLNTFCRVTDPRDGGACEAWVCDVSAGGVGLFTERRFEPGTALDLMLTNEKRRFTCRVRVRVIHSDIQLPNDAWLHGAAFDRPLTADELAMLLPEE